MAKRNFYYGMDEDEILQSEKDKLLWKYIHGKISYDTYLDQIDKPIFYSIIDKEESKDIEERRIIKKQTESIKEKKRQEEYLQHKEGLAKFRNMLFIILLALLILFIFLF